MFTQMLILGVSKYQTRLEDSLLAHAYLGYEVSTSLASSIAL